VVISFTIAVGLIHGGLLVAAWRAARRLETPVPTLPSPPRWPPVQIILPFAGAASTLEASLDDLAAQAYPDFEIHLACHAEDETACTMAEAWIQKQSALGPHVQLARAKTAHRCSQKNQNLLAALRAPGPADSVLVFTDAGYRRPMNWLQELVAPIATGQASVTTGYYFAATGAGWRSAMRPVTATLLFLVQQIPTLRQPWGGATAFPRQLFEELKIAELWSTNIVDDVVLAKRLRSARIPITGINRPTLLAPASNASGFAWSEWFTRQLGYIRVIQPGVWVGLGLGFGLLAAGVLWMAGILLCIWTSGPLWIGSIAVLDGVLLMALGLRLRRLHPAPGPRLRWLTAFLGFILTAPICHLRSGFSRTIRWRGVRYRVGSGGCVLATSATPPPAVGDKPGSMPSSPSPDS